MSLAALGVVVPHEAPVEALIAASLGLVAVENAWHVGAVRRVAVPAGAVAALAALALGAAWRGREAALALAGAALFSACWFPLLARSASPERLRGGVAALFGLVHGFGFARVLAGLELPSERLVGALFGFNVGVELGQLAVVLVSWPLLTLARRRWSPEAVAVASSTGALALAAYWVVTRTFG
ncbi:MAG: HupE/UreJ family protein [Polyangiaceae bacterium]|nr:HupE/UreJ family protein [Polyangiaceae bacterium]